MIRMMDELNRYTEIINSGLYSQRDIEEVKRLIEIGKKIFDWFKEQAKYIKNVHYDPDTCILAFDIKNTSGLEFKELEFDILVEETLHTLSFRDWKGGEYREIRFTYYSKPTGNIDLTLEGDSIAFELLDESVGNAGDDSSYPVKIPLGNWILKSGEDGSKKVVPLKKFFDGDIADGLKSEDILDMSIDELGLSLRSYNNLMRAGCLTVGDIASRTKDEIKSIRNIGQKSFEEIEGHLEALGLSFKEPDDEDDIGEDASYSVDVTGIVDHIIKAMVPESVSEEEEGDSAESLTIDEDTTNDVEEDNGDREEECFLRIERDNHQETSRLEKARREVRLQRLISKEGEKPGLEEMMSYLKYLGYNAEEIEYALQELEDEPSEEVGGEEFD